MRSRDWPPRLAVAAATAGFAACLAVWLGGGGVVDLPWAPSLGLRLRFELDGLGALYGLLATGVGVAVFTYSAAYLPDHLEHQERPPREAIRFYGLLVLFMVSMVGLATAQDLIVLFVFWDLTAVASYFLIGFDRHQRDARWAALMALLVTGVSAVLLLIGVLMLAADHGTFSVPDVLEAATAGTGTTVATALIVVAALAKSAQVPMHFWLPRAMVAPTPVSAYLHSAAMVAAGVLLIGRVYPLIELSDVVRDGLLVVGLASMVVGGVMALARDDLKQILACSTISQYGYVVFLYGLGGAAGVVGGAFYVLVHALAKSALFLTAGAVAKGTGERRLSRLGGLAGPMPVLAGASLVAVATVASLPLTAGFFADELLFKAATERGTGYAIAAMLVAALTLGYLGRFWAGIFLGPRRTDAGTLSRRLVAPVAALATVCLAGGLAVGPLERLAEAAGRASGLDSTAGVALAYHLDLRAENVLALCSFALGGALVAARARLSALAASVVGPSARLGPDRAYTFVLRTLNAASDAVHRLEVRDLRTRVAAVLLPGGALVVLGVAVTPTTGAYRVGPLSGDDLALMLVLCLLALAALATTVPRGHLTMVLTLSTVGLSLAVAYALMGAPNVALVTVLVETVFALLFLGVFSLLPSEVLRREATIATRGSRRWRDPLVGVVAGAVAFVVVWGALSRPTEGDAVAERQTELAPEAHADNVVTAILADFRALDTLGEITVVAVAFLGVAGLLRRGRLW